MMKPLQTVTLLIMLTSICLLPALKFDPYYFQSKTIMACFTMEAVGNFEGKLDFRIEDGIVKTNLPSFDDLAKLYRFVDLSQAHPYVKVPTWNDNGKYLQNIYRIFLESDDLIDEAVTALSKDPNLHYAEFETINRTHFTPNDPMISQQYALNLMQMYEAWNWTLGSRDVIVSVTDTGVKWNHPDLRANIWINPAEAPGMTINWDTGSIQSGNGVDAGEGGGRIDDLIGWDFFNNDNNPMQNFTMNDHGTHVAGAAGAVGNNTIGITGTAPNVSILSCKGSSNTSQSTGISFGYNQIQYSAEIGAHIINASWGGPGGGSYANQIVNYATHLGSLVVTAAGNNNAEHTSTNQEFPADCVNALTVVATDQNDMKANFSDYGVNMAVAAPGVNILSTIIANNGYDSYSGTSMASPLVAGVAALIKSMHPELSPQQIKQRIRETADFIDHLHPTMYHGKLGSGRVNAYAALMYDKIPYIVMDDMTIEELTGDGDGIPNPGETIRLKAMLYNVIDPYTGLGWQPSMNTIAKLRCHYPGVIVIDSVATYGNIWSGSSMWNNATPYKFQTVSTLPSEPIPFELYITSNETSNYPYTKTIPFTVPLSLIQQGWPKVLGGATQSSPIIWDLNSDGHKDIIFGDHLGRIHALKADGSTYLPGFPYESGSSVIGSIALGKLSANDGRYLVANLQNGSIVCLNRQGQLQWTASGYGTLRSTPVIADLNGDGISEVITVTQTRRVVVLTADGNNYPGFPITLDGAMLASPAIADLNSNGILDIICGTIAGSLHAINPATAQNLAGFPITMSSGTQNPITIANIDNDSQPEILVATSPSSGQLLAYNHDGSLLFAKNIGSQIKSGAVLADMNNNGTKEIVLVSGNGDVFVMNPNGTDLPGFPVNIGNSTECTPVVAAFDGSYLPAVIFGDTNGYLHAVRVNGTQSPNFPIRLNGNLKISAAVGDIDSDQDIDIVIPNDNGMYVIDVKRPVYSYNWYCYLNTYNRAGNAFQPTPVNDGTAPAITTELAGNYPNPFNPETTIVFSLADNGIVSIDIFNVKGQRVRSLINDHFDSGRHSIFWNGTDDNGRSVASGIYYYRMKSSKYTSTKKMILMK